MIEKERREDVPELPIEHSNINGIIQTLRNQSAELPWVEFKRNNANPQEIGEYISALSNTAALYNQNYGILIWGIDNETHKIVGTTFDPTKAKQGNQLLDLWISTQLDPQVQFFFHSSVVDNEAVVLLEITAAYSTPVKFRDIEYIRIGSAKKKLKDFPNTERQLWAIFSQKSFEELIAVEGISDDTVLRLLDYRSYFEMLSEELPSSDTAVIERLLKEKMITRNVAGNYNVTNIGALLYAHRLSDFPTLERKMIRVIGYSGEGRVSSASREIALNKGYANGFEDLITYISGMVPDKEAFGPALRKNIPVYPDKAIRELIGNLMIHQDMFARGTGPMVELFSSRIEVTNPGAPLIAKDRFVDHPPVSRNEKMAGFLRRVGVGEERGTGFDKIVIVTELNHLPPPEIDIYENHTRVVLYAYRPFSKMSKSERQRACYLHACIKRVHRDYMTNSSLRERFAVDAKNSSMITRLLNDACDTGLVKIAEDASSGNNRKYLPYWA
jgi:predicted HTH transcriptional regulator